MGKKQSGHFLVNPLRKRVFGLVCVCVCVFVFVFVFLFAGGGEGRGGVVLFCFGAVLVVLVEGTCSFLEYFFWGSKGTFL